MSHRTFVLVGVLLILSVFLVSCTLVSSDEPARFAEEWLIALSTRDALKADGLTCKKMREELRSGQLMAASFVTLAEIFIGPIEVEVDASEVVFTTVEQKGNQAIVQVRGEIRLASLGTVDSEVIDQRWIMLHEENEWRWCGDQEEIEQAAVATEEAATTRLVEQAAAVEMIQQLPLYDDFNASSLNTTLWGPSDNISSGMSYELTGGELVLASESALRGGGFDMVLSRVAGPISEPISLAALMKIDSKSHGSWGFSKIQLMTTLEGNSWWTQCVLGGNIGGRQPTFGCDVAQWIDNKVATEFVTQPAVNIAFDQWYLVRIEVNPRKMSFNYYLDGTLVDSYAPKNSSKLTNARFTPRVGIWVREGVSLISYFDDVRHGREPQ